MKGENITEKSAGGVEITNCEVKPISYIEEKILTIRGLQVMLDRDLAELYGVENKRLNEQVKRNIERFPGYFMFSLTADEYRVLRSQFATFNEKVAPKYLPHAFTEQGVAMLSAVLRSPTAVSVSIRIMEAFVAMRQFIATNVNLVKRFETIEHSQLEMRQHQDVADRRIDEVFKRLDAHTPPVEGIFYDGQIFDAHTFVSDLIRSARERIVLIDNYIDDTVLKRLDKRSEDVDATVYTQRISAKLRTDIDSHNAQYRPIDVKIATNVHDRFMVIDETVYHIGASIKDLGRKVFAFSKMGINVDELIGNIK